MSRITYRRLTRPHIPPALAERDHERIGKALREQYLFWKRIKQLRL